MTPPIAQGGSHQLPAHIDVAPPDRVGAPPSASPAGTVRVIRTSACAVPRMRHFPSRLVAEFRRILKIPRPDADLRLPGAVFIGDVVEGVFSEGDCLALLDHPLADIDAVDRAEPHHTAIPVSVAADAAHRLAADPLSERLRRIKAARIAGAVFGAELGNSGASMPQSRIRSSLISMVSPSMTNAGLP